MKNSEIKKPTVFTRESTVSPYTFVYYQSGSLAVFAPEGKRRITKSGDGSFFRINGLLSFSTTTIKRLVKKLEVLDLLPFQHSYDFVETMHQELFQDYLSSRKDPFESFLAFQAGLMSTRAMGLQPLMKRLELTKAHRDFALRWELAPYLLNIDLGLFMTTKNFGLRAATEDDFLEKDRAVEEFSKSRLHSKAWELFQANRPSAWIEKIYDSAAVVPVSWASPFRGLPSSFFLSLTKEELLSLAATGEDKANNFYLNLSTFGDPAEVTEFGFLLAYIFTNQGKSRALELLHYLARKNEDIRERFYSSSSFEQETTKIPPVEELLQSMEEHPGLPLEWLF